MHDQVIVCSTLIEILQSHHVFMFYPERVIKRLSYPVNFQFRNCSSYTKLSMHYTHNSIHLKSNSALTSHGAAHCFCSLLMEITCMNVYIVSVCLYLLSTLISFSRLLWARCFFFRHFRAYRFPVVLSFTIKTSEKDPLYQNSKDRGTQIISNPTHPRHKIQYRLMETKVSQMFQTVTDTTLFFCCSSVMVSYFSIFHISVTTLQCSRMMIKYLQELLNKQ